MKRPVPDRAPLWEGQEISLVQIFLPPILVALIIPPSGQQGKAISYSNGIFPQVPGFQDDVIGWFLIAISNFSFDIFLLFGLK
jgi:hypothetical protein